MDTATPAKRIKRLTLFGEVNDVSVGNVVQRIHECNERGDLDLIELYICTYGGRIYPGMGLYDVIRLSPVPIDTVAFGHCQSMGVTLLQAGSRRFATENTRLMIHPGSSGGMPDARMEEAAIAANECKQSERRSNQLVSRRVGIALAQYSMLMGDRKYLSAAEAKQLNFIDDIKSDY